MNVVTSFLHLIMAMILFFAALGLCFLGGGTVMNMVLVEEMERQDEVLYETSDAEIIYCIKGDELMSKLLCGSEIDIQVCCLDGSETVFLSGENGERVLQKAEFSWDSEYRLEYKYGNSGNKKMLRFVECVKE